MELSSRLSDCFYAFLGGIKPSVNHLEDSDLIELANHIQKTHDRLSTLETVENEYKLKYNDATESEKFSMYKTLDKNRDTTNTIFGLISLLEDFQDYAINKKQNSMAS